MPAFPTIRTEIAGHAVAELARQFGTPVFVYDAASIRRRLDELRCFDHVRYAEKACSNLAILSLLHHAGAVVDTVSAFEIRRAMAAGFKPGGTPPAIVYTADIFDAEALRLVVAHKIHVNCGSPDMIDQYGRVAPGKDITLRVNPGFGHGHSQKTNTGGPQSKHGIWHEQLHEALVAAKHHNLTVAGLHMHIGSGTDMEHLAQVCCAIEESAHKIGRSIRSLSVGGGLPIAYREDDLTVDVNTYFELCDDMRHRVGGALGHGISLEIEPGRYLVAESGFLIAEIRAVKRQADNLFYLVDAGFNNLARPILYGAYHPISIVPTDGNANRPEQDVIVGGPLCESGDIFTQEEGGFVARRRLPQAKVGDLLVIECAGAYCSTMGSNYNSKPMAPEVLIDADEVHLIRRRQTFEELTAAESIPPR